MIDFVFYFNLKATMVIMEYIFLQIKKQMCEPVPCLLQFSQKHKLTTYDTTKVTLGELHLQLGAHH